MAVSVPPTNLDIVYPVMPASPSDQDRDIELPEAAVAVRLGNEESVIRLQAAPLKAYPLGHEAVAATVLAGLLMVWTGTLQTPFR